MPNYGMPGVAVDRRRSLLVGGVAIAVIATLVLGVTLYRNMRSNDGLKLVLHTAQIGDGVQNGTPVRLGGVVVGKVDDIIAADRGTQRIQLQLNRSQVRTLDDSLQVNYAPANLFGISELDLVRGAGGSPLRQNAVIDLTGANGDRVYDATMGALLRGLSQVGGSTLTPQLSSAITQVATDVQALAPLAQALVTVAQTITDNQTMPASQLVGRLGPAFDGGGQFAGATIEVLDQLLNDPALQTNRAHYDQVVHALTGVLLPGLSAFAGQAGSGLSGTTDTLAPMLSALAQMVPQPQQSSADVGALLARLRSAMPDTPNGPELTVKVDLNLVPGLAAGLGAGGTR